MNTQAIANHLNILESAIIKIEEWATVMFVVAKGIGARFVSKKTVEVKEVNIKMDDIKEIDPTESTPLGKIKVYAGSDLIFFNRTPRRIEWERDGEIMVAILTPKEAKSTQPNYKLTSGDKSRLVPVSQIIKSLDVSPASKITPFEATDFVRPRL